jgi:hypothetical protein
MMKNHTSKKFDIDLHLRRDPYSPCRFDLTLSLTQDTFKVLREIDQRNVGTEDYMGIFWFWDDEYHRALKDVPCRVRAAAHDALVTAGLTPNGFSPEHTALILMAITRNTIRENIVETWRACFPPNKTK